MTLKKRAKTAVKLLAFLFVVSVCVGLVNELVKPKYYYTELWPSTNTYLDFYDLEKNSVDVLILGSSHAICSINPQVIYDNYGITSYNLSSEQQSALITYYWLKEALKYQSPKAVILDLYTFYKYEDEHVNAALNCDESSVRKALDSMRFSPLKWEASREVERHDSTQSALSFMFLNIRYHARWTGLDENDYTEASMIDHGGVKGYTCRGGTNPGRENYVPFKDADANDAEPEEMVDIAKEYGDKIIDLCKENGIQLIFVNIPAGENVERYKASKQYAEQKGIPYYDFDEETLYNAIGYNAFEDMLGHPNYKGAEKVSDYLGKLLKEEYNVAAREDASYDESRKLYEHKIHNIVLTEETDAYEYLDMLNDSNYSIFLFAPKSYSAYLNDELMNKIRNLGFKTDLCGVEDGTHYCAVKDGNNITEKMDKKDMSLSGSIRNGAVIYKANIDTREMLDEYDTYSFTVAGVECGNQNPGIDIVVYDNDLKCIADKVNINTTVEELTLTRY